jgi:very-short-patch-repair endonuclease
MDYKLYTNLCKEQEYIGCLVKAFKHKEYAIQYRVGSYKIDLYFLDINLAIECDELNHKYRNTEYESTRELYIKDQLKCEFLRFNPDDKDFCVFDLINEIMKYYS